MRKLNQTGFSLVEIVIAGVVIIAIGAIGLFSYNNFVTKKTSTRATDLNDSSSESLETSVPKIQSEGDLNTADTSLDQTDVDGSSQKDIDAALN